jgi:hypothetical protein
MHPKQAARASASHLDDGFSAAGENSLYGLLMRSLAQPLFPAWEEIFTLRPGTAFKHPILPGYRRHGRVIRGTVNALERACRSLNAVPAKLEDLVAPVADGADEPDADDKEATPGKILHKASEHYQLPQWDYGARTGVGELGRVKITYWVADPLAGRHRTCCETGWTRTRRSW